MTRFLVAPVVAVAVLSATPAHAQLPNLGNCVAVKETVTIEELFVQVCIPPTN